jgi:hypothetical protein
MWLWSAPRRRIAYYLEQGDFSMGRKAASKALVARAAELFLGDVHSTVEAICEKLNKEMLDAKELGQIEGAVSKVIRENFYRLIKQAREHGLIRLVPPLDVSLPRQIAQVFEHNAEDFTVVETLGKGSNALVAARAAEIVLDLLKMLQKSKGINPETGHVTIGL